MTSEAVMEIETAPPISFHLSGTTAVPKGSLMKLVDPFGAAISDANNDEIAGIAATEKISGDGKSYLGIFREGYFKMFASGSIGIGDPVGSAATNTPNMVYSLLTIGELSGSKCLGLAMEEATDAQSLIIHVQPQAILMTPT